MSIYDYNVKCIVYIYMYAHVFVYAILLWNPEPERKALELIREAGTTPEMCVWYLHDLVWR